VITVAGAEPGRLRVADHFCFTGIRDYPAHLRWPAVPRHELAKWPVFDWRSQLLPPLHVKLQKRSLVLMLPFGIKDFGRWRTAHVYNRARHRPSFVSWVRYAFSRWSESSERFSPFLKPRSYPPGLWRWRSAA